MFVTYSKAEVPIGVLAGHPEVHHWRYAELSYSCLWFYISIGYVRSNLLGRSTLLLSGLGEFEQLLSDRGPDLWLEEVLIVSPSEINGTESWKMDRLAALEEADEQSTGQLIYVYRLENDFFYIEGQCSNLAEITITRTIFTAQTDLSNASKKELP